MNVKKLVTNTLAVVGTVAIVDRVVNAISTKGTKAISEAMLNNEIDVNSSQDSDQCSFFDSDYDKTQNSNKCDGNNNFNDSAAFPEIKKYNCKDSSNTFEYAIKTKPTNPQEM